MNLEKMAALIVKLFGLYFILWGIISGCYIPVYADLARHTKLGYGGLYGSELRLHVVTFLLLVGFGLVLMSFWKPIIRLLTRRCDTIFEAQKPLENSLNRVGEETL